MVKKINLFNRFEIKLTNKWLYSFIALGIVLILGVGVYATWANPVTHVGHSWDEIEPCDDYQILKMNSAGDWACASDNVGTGGGASLPSCEDNQIIKYNPNYCVAPVGYECPTGTSSDPSDIWICADLPSGGSSLWTEDGSDIYYNGGKVGIGTGTTTPGAMLDVLHSCSGEGCEDYAAIQGRIPAGGWYGIGVKGIGHYGVYGKSTSSDGYGVYGISTSSNGYGLYSNGNAKVTGNLKVEGGIIGGNVVEGLHLNEDHQLCWPAGDSYPTGCATTSKICDAAIIQTSEYLEICKASICQTSCDNYCNNVVACNGDLTEYSCSGSSVKYKRDTSSCSGNTCNCQCKAATGSYNEEYTTYSSELCVTGS